MLGPMILTHIKPSRIGFEKRTFQGVNCDNVDKVVTETHSMKWMSCRLRKDATALKRLGHLGGGARP